MGAGVAMYLATLLVIEAMAPVRYGAVAAESQCKAILPLRTVTVLDKYVNVDGTLLLNGKSQCTVVNIECRQDSGLCSMASSDVLSGDLPVISRIARSEYPIIKWADRELVAAGEAGLCGWSEIYINLATKEAHLTSRTTTARPGCDEAAKSELLKGLFDNGAVRIFDIGSDPYWSRR